MRRRAFLGLFGTAAIAPKQVVNEGMNALNLGPVNLLTSLQDGEVYGGSVSSDTSWAVERLAKRAARKFLDIERERVEFKIHELDVNTHALRSVSLSNKIRISRDKQFRLHEERQKSFLERVIAGVEDY